MRSSRIEKRRAPRFSVQASATLRDANGRSSRATVVDISSSGIAAEMQEPLRLSPGDSVMIDVTIESAAPENYPLPAWGVAKVVRVEGARVSVEFTSAGFHPLPAPNWPEEW